MWVAPMPIERSGLALKLQSGDCRCKTFVQRPEGKPSQLRGGEQVNINPPQPSPHEMMGLQKSEHLVMTRYRRLR